jgi:hypothetical protein
LDFGLQQLKPGYLGAWTRGQRVIAWSLPIAAMVLSGCKGGCSARVAPHGGPSIPGGGGSASSAPRGATSTESPSSAPLVVDERGIEVRGERIDSATADADQRLSERLAGLPLDGQPVSVRAASGAKLSEVAVLTRALGRVGASQIDLTLSSGTARATSATLKVWPLGRVPMHEDRCGARVTIKSNNTAELKYLQKGKAVTIPQGPNGPDISSLVASLRERMKSCPTTLWMLAAEGDASWKTAFEIGAAVSYSADAAQIRYLMIL